MSDNIRIAFAIIVCLIIIRYLIVKSYITGAMYVAVDKNKNIIQHPFPMYVRLTTKYDETNTVIPVMEALSPNKKEPRIVFPMCSSFLRGYDIYTKGQLQTAIRIPILAGFQREGSIIHSYVAAINQHIDLMCIV